MVLRDGDKCPKSEEIIIIRSELGCYGCVHLVRIIGKLSGLSVRCNYMGDEEDSKEQTE